MKKLFVMVLVLSLALVPALALAADKSLTVRGNATISVSPDQAVLTVGYAGENADPGAIQYETAQKIDAITAAVRALGVTDEQIATTSFGIYPVNSMDGSVSRLSGYRVEHMLSVTVTNLDIVGDVLDAALAAGANQSYGINFISSKQNDVYQQALKQAILNGMAKADAMAVAAGVWLGTLTSISEQADYAYMNTFSAKGAYEGGTAGDAGIGGTLMAGSVEISAAVELVYEVR